jgi:hypothetical protein
MITQLSVFLENKPGRLADVVGCLSDSDINIHALSIADTTDFGILRLIVAEPDRAREILKSHGLPTRETDVICVDLAQKPGSLAHVLRELEKINSSIEYMYAFTSRAPGHDAMAIVRLENQDEAASRLNECDFSVIGSEILAQMG